MRTVKRWQYYLIIAASVYASIALYGLLRTHNIPVTPSIGICAIYGMGFTSLIKLFLSHLK